MKLNENCSKGSGDMEGTPNSTVKPMTLTLSLHSRVIGSAHQLTERNIGVMFNENLTNSLGYMERTQNSRVNPMILKCDLGDTLDSENWTFLRFIFNSCLK